MYSDGMRRLLVAMTALGVAAGVAWALWPERWAVNGPMIHLLFGRSPKKVADGSVLGRLRVPAGLSLTRFASDVPNVRLLRFTSEGDLLASQSRAGRVLLVRSDANGDGRADAVTTLVGELDRPHGLDVHEGWLYVAESGGVRRIRFDAAARAVSGPLETIVSGLPEGGNHWSRTIRFGRDGGLYVSIGSSCNVCAEKDPRRAAMVRYEPDGSREELFATGLRNAVAFDWHPVTGDLYATDNGRDLLGDDFPPCELNRVVRGGFYGWPFANADRVLDPDLGRGHEADAARSIPPVHAFRPHNAPLGITFLRQPQRPEFEASALVALHGSWNRTKKDGYKVVALHWRADGKIVEQDFLTGFLEGEDVIGRPVDVAEGPDGAIYVSDDYGGSIFRIARGGTAATAADPASAVASDALASTTEVPAPITVSPETVAKGRRVYEQYGCALCHESRVPKAGVVARPLKGLRQRYTVETLVEFFKTPTPPMPVPAISDAERRDLAAYLLSRSE